MRVKRPIPPLAPVETAVLYAVARYRFINVELLHRVVDATRQTIRDAARRLRVLGLLGSTGPSLRKFDPDDPDDRREFGKPSFFWVSEKGATYLAERRQADPAVPFVIGSKRRPDEGKEDEHRLGVVAFHITFRAWAEATGKVGVSFLSDFEPGSFGMEKVTAVPYVTASGIERAYRPDGYARFRVAPDAPQELMVLEFERGGARNDPSPFFRKKLPGIEFAARHELVEEYKQHRSAAPYLIVFATDRLRERALPLWPDKDARIWQRFFIKSLPEIEADGADFSRGWYRPDGSRPSLFAGPGAPSPAEMPAQMG